MDFDQNTQKDMQPDNQGSNNQYNNSQSDNNQYNNNQYNSNNQYNNNQYNDRQYNNIQLNDNQYNNSQYSNNQLNGNQYNGSQYNDNQYSNNQLNSNQYTNNYNQYNNNNQYNNDYNNGYNNNGYNNNYPYYNRGSYNYQEPGSSFATAAMVLGIISIVTSFTFTIYPPFMLGSIAIILALLSKGRRPKLLSKARAGLICAVAGLILNTVIVTLSMVLLFTNPYVRSEVNKTFEQQYGMSFDEMWEEMMKDSGF